MRQQHVVCIWIQLKLRFHRMRQRLVFCIWMSKTIRSLLFICEISHQKPCICIVELGQLCYYAFPKEEIMSYILAHSNTKYMMLSHSVGTQLKHPHQVLSLVSYVKHASSSRSKMHHIATLQMTALPLNYNSRHVYCSLPRSRLPAKLDATVPIRPSLCSVTDGHHFQSK